MVLVRPDIEGISPLESAAELIGISWFLGAELLYESLCLSVCVYVCLYVCLSVTFFLENLICILLLIHLQIYL